MLIISIIDSLTGEIKGWKFKKLRSQSTWFGYF
ncbi:hypothetical protein BSU6633_04924 [Bacillus spizizenii ATCC 6633 = JCM 2499]|nr:hypothetical protein BSU6633_04924 [Bacillus spizizenii ATCC 6633 = JCM 2499]